MNDSYHEELHHDILIYVARPVLVIVGYHTVVIVVVFVLQTKHKLRVRRQLTDCDLFTMHQCSDYCNMSVICFSYIQLF